MYKLFSVHQKKYCILSNKKGFLNKLPCFCMILQKNGGENVIGRKGSDAEFTSFHYKLNLFDQFLGEREVLLI